ncbi:pentapeptide repeat-containing protein [Alkalinema sp. FACHB-956]|uniref:pentapeptide repeat-containing protein n=1 Tax=Alkalinema sp. FACHB-956 TaxID=2692768 RepID=UPI001689F588|nr:pentapeptide repeat-containing protein [Alkalinema sp. FACHB-956]MBD2329515.1 pentapeptide repeat-containing protein [Alkalinema sp. FACHB-956]
MSPEELLEQYAIGKRDFGSIRLNEANLSSANLSGADLSAANLTVVNLTNANLSQTNLSGAKLNVTKLNGANLQRANLQQACLNVANLSLADLSETNLIQAHLIKAELERADLSRAQLQRANLSAADLRDAKLRCTNLSRANLSRADVRRAVLTAANLEQAILHSCDLSGANLSGANLRQTELRQANLSRAILQGVNLSGANLRWADLSGADLRWADLSGAILSGANLTGADLSHATLLNTTLVHVDLTRANLSGVDWAGADLTGAQLTGAKLYNTFPFGPKVDDINCRWVDLSQNGDRSKTYQFSSNDAYEFFYRVPPTVEVTIDDRLDPESYSALIVTYQQLTRQTKLTMQPPNITIHRGRTILRFELIQDTQLFLIAYAAILPFGDARSTHQNLTALLKMIPSRVFHQSNEQLQQYHMMVKLLSHNTQQVNRDRLLQAIPLAAQKLPFFQAPTQTTLVNADGQRLTIYSNPMFGKRSVPFFREMDEFQANVLPEFQLAGLEQVIEFINGFRDLQRVAIG